MTDAPPSSVLFICDFPPGFTGATHHGEGVGGTEALVVVLAETLAARGIDVTVAARVPGASRLHGVSYIPVSSARPREAGVTVLVKRWSEAAAGAGSRRFFLATDVHVPDPAELARNITWSNVSAALSPFMRIEMIAVVAAPMMQVLPRRWSSRIIPSLRQKARPGAGVLLVPDRGLYYLKDLFPPSIRRRVPEATLAITSDFRCGARPRRRGVHLRFSRTAGRPNTRTLIAPRSCRQRPRARARLSCTFEEASASRPPNAWRPCGTSHHECVCPDDHGRMRASLSTAAPKLVLPPRFVKAAVRPPDRRCVLARAIHGVLAHARSWDARRSRINSWRSSRAPETDRG